MSEAVISELIDLSAVSVDWDQVVLDPHNPRLFEVELGDDVPRVPDAQVVDESLQADLLSAMRTRIGIDDLVEKMKKLGFLTIDRIVVRPLDDVTLEDGRPCYVVLEGNRRVAALRTIRTNQRSYLALNEAVRGSLDRFEVLVYSGGDPDIAWDLQGLRHMGGTKAWGPYQQARFLVELKERRQFEITDVAQLAGIGRTTAARLIRSYYGFAQAIEDEDFGDQVSERDFSIFQEAIFYRNQSPLWEWLEWDDSARVFANEERLSTLLGLMKDASDGGPRISRVNPDLRDRFTKLLLEDHEAELNSFLDGEVSLDQALSQIQRVDDEAVVREELADLSAQRASLGALLDRLVTLPLPRIVERGRVGDFVDVLTEISSAAKQQVGFLEGAAVDQVEVTSN